jgi:hypothetical protein
MDVWEVPRSSRSGLDRGFLMDVGPTRARIGFNAHSQCIGRAKQRLAVPELSNGHSGNTFGFACFFAALRFWTPEQAVDAHGALTRVVGCAENGCMHPDAA